MLTQHLFRFTPLFWAGAILFMLLGLIACSDMTTSDSTAGQANNALDLPDIPTPVATPELTANSNAAESAEPTTEPIRYLTVWVLPEIAPIPELPGGNTQQAQFASFANNHPNIDLRIEQKASNGPASLLNYLETGRDIAPQALPDIALVPAFLLPELVNKEQVYPLEDLIPAADFEDLLPVGRQMARVGEEFYAYPYATTGLHHAIYNSDVITTSLSTDWGTLYEEDYAFIFPASSASGIQLLLQFYLAEGGTLRNETGQIQLESEPLQNALQSLQTARATGLILEESSITTTEDDAWRVFLSGRVAIAQTSSTQYFNQQGQEADITYAPLPGKETALVPQVSGWVWVITTPDPARQALAAELLLWLVNGPNLGDWTLQNRYLPPRYAAFDRWGDDPYTLFLQSELERSAMLPTTVSGAVSDALNNALGELFASPSPDIQTIAITAATAVKQ